MPTVIDSLVVELRLQSAQFASEGRQATTEFTRMQQQVQRASQTIGQAFSRGGAAQRSTREFLSTFENQLDALALMVNNLGNQTRRTGRDIEGAGKTGAAGLFSLGAAALSAFAALKAVQSVVKSIGDSTNSVAQGNRADWAGNLNPEWRQRFEQYAYRADRVPIETTRSTLVSFAQKIEAFQRGERIPEFGELARIGINFNQRPEQVVEDLAKASQGREGANITGWLTSAGFGPLARTIGRGPQALQQGMAQSGATILGPDQRKNIDELWQAVNRFDIAWDSLTQKIIAANPEWAKWIDEISKFLERIQNDTDAIGKLSLGVDALAIAIGATLVKAVWAFSKAVLGASAEIATSPLGQLLLGGYAGYKLLEKGLDIQKNPPTLPAGAENDPTDDTGTFGMLPGLVKRGWNWLTGPTRKGGERGMTAPIPPAAGGGASGGFGAGFGGRGHSGNAVEVPDIPGMTPSEKNFLGLVLQHESMGGQNVMNYVGKAQGLDPTTAKGYTAQGYYQMLNSHLHGPLGESLGLSGASNVMALSLYDQTRLALALSRQPGGQGNWVNFNSRLAAAVARGDRSRTVASQDNIVVPPHHDMGDLRAGGIQVNEAEGPPLNGGGDTGQSLRVIRAAQAAGRPQSLGGSNTHNDNDFHGGINVTVPPGSDGYAVGGAISRRLKDEMLVGTVNTGIN